MWDKRLRLLRGTYTGVNVVPLLVGPDNESAVYSSDIFPGAGVSAEEHLQRAKLILWSRNGAPCKCIAHPTKDGTKFPHGAFLATTACLILVINPLCVCDNFWRCGDCICVKRKKS